MGLAPGDSTTAVPSRKERARRRPEARLVLVHPPELAAEMELAGAESVFGRAPDGGVSIAHPTLSRRHLGVRWDGGVWKYVASDLGSKNGSSVDGTALAGTPRILSDGAVIRAGEVIFVYEEGPGVHAPE